MKWKGKNESGNKQKPVKKTQKRKNSSKKKKDKDQKVRE